MVVRGYMTASVKPECFDEFLAALREALPPTRPEAGNLRSDPHLSGDDPATVVLYQEWEDYDAIAAHQQSEHRKPLRARTEGQLLGPPQPHYLRNLDG